MNQVRPDSQVDVRALFDAQRRFFESGGTRPREVRADALRALVDVVKKNEARIAEALHADLRKHELEAFGTETFMVLHEAKLALKNLSRWTKTRRSLPPLVAQVATTAVHPDPLGTNVIFGAWNYPIQLTLQPLVPCLAAGNVALLKPSELSPASSELMTEMVRSAFSPEHVAMVEGGADIARQLLDIPFDHFFYTGGTQVGRIIAKAAAEHLARCTLELGGKSPCFVGRSANLDSAAMRIAWGRWTNAGQTCVAPDYVLVDASVHDALIDKLRAVLAKWYGADPQHSDSFGRIVNDRHFARVSRLIDPAKVVIGGQTDAADRYIAPTVLGDVSMDDAVMQEEIFGPILPLIKVASTDEAIALSRRHPNPLALYVFSSDRAEVDRIVGSLPFGCGAVNNAVMQMSDPTIPFGGVRTSGVGAYHGKHGFDCFTHYKGVLESSASTLWDVPLKHPPYTGKLDTLKLILR